MTLPTLLRWLRCAVIGHDVRKLNELRPWDATCFQCVSCRHYFEDPFGVFRWRSK